MSTTKKFAAAAGAVALAGTAGCGGEQSALQGAGTRSAAINDNTLLMTVLGGIIWLIVTVALLYALVRWRRRRTLGGEAGRGETLTVVVGGLILPTVIIVVVISHAIQVLDEIDPRAAGDDAMVVEVTGHQFWWEVRYPEQDVVTANEVHIPAGERVKLELVAEDVIHSFWLPALTGKMDMIPGRVNETWVETDQPGIYWGQCAEYCGLQHARMRFAVVVHERDSFDDWLQLQQEPHPRPVPGEDDEDELVAEGRQVFMGSSCVYCHAIAGTEATGTLGPDLSNLASRQMLAAGTIPNTRGNLAGWILDPQSIKPGSLMPATDMSGEELQALLAYLETLE